MTHRNTSVKTSKTLADLLVTGHLHHRVVILGDRGVVVVATTQRQSICHIWQIAVCPANAVYYNIIVQHRSGRSSPMSSKTQTHTHVEYPSYVRIQGDLPNMVCGQPQFLKLLNIPSKEYPVTRDINSFFRYLKINNLF